jgi:hypoxanthine phosphoribosyltransferase
MESLKILDKEFVPFINSDELQKRIEALGLELTNDYRGKRPVFLGVLNGCFRFVADLIQHVDLSCEVSFIKLSSYSGTESTGQVKALTGLPLNLEGRDIIVVEDIVDTGTTIEYLVDTLLPHNPASVKIATLLYKPEAYKKEVAIDYVGFEIPNLFVVGYGLDYDEMGRNLNEIYQIKA